MKKLSLLFGFMLIAFAAQAQDENSMDVDNATNNYNNYNHWSLELQGGVTKPSRPMASGYSTDTPSFWQGDLGVRYMINDLFGFKLDFGYNHFESGSDSNNFESQIFRTSLQGVVNAGSLLGFREWTNTLNFLVHGGVGYGVLSSDEPIDTDWDHDNMGFLVVGITPQVRLSNHFALTADVSMIGNARQDMTFDGTRSTSTRGFNGMYMNGSIGLTYYFGANQKSHADWFNKNEEGSTQQRLGNLSDDVNKIKNDLKDTDRDGVPDYLDEEPNTPAGIAVDTKGRAIDKNNNGIPDELEGALDKRYKNSGAQGSGGTGTIEKLINDGYVNVYFKFDSTDPEVYSLQSINYLVKYMNENSSAKADLIGYADEIGNPDYNKQLSKKRAERVKNILVASGIDESRLTIKGNGEDNSVDKSSKDARQLVRRVTFKLK